MIKVPSFKNSNARQSYACTMPFSIPLSIHPMLVVTNQCWSALINNWSNSLEFWGGCASVRGNAPDLWIIGAFIFIVFVRSSGLQAPFYTYLLSFYSLMYIYEARRTNYWSDNRPVIVQLGSGNHWSAGLSTVRTAYRNYLSVCLWRQPEILSFILSR